jgi:hypothetical protein
MSLTGFALIVSASSRLSYSAAVLVLLAGIYGITLTVIRFGKIIIPEKYRTSIIILILTFISSLFYLVMNMINPVSALELYVMVFLVPITFLSSQIVKRSDALSHGEAIVLGIKEALILGGTIIVVALIREPLAYGTLSLPFGGKPLNILPNSLRERLVLQTFAGPLGGFILTACLITIVRLILHQKDDFNQENEEQL